MLYTILMVQMKLLINIEKQDIHSSIWLEIVKNKKESKIFFDQFKSMFDLSALIYKISIVNSKNTHFVLQESSSFSF